MIYVYMDLTNLQMGPISSRLSNAQVGVVPNVPTHCRTNATLDPIQFFTTIIKNLGQKPGQSVHRALIRDPTRTQIADRVTHNPKIRFHL